MKKTIFLTVIGILLIIIPFCFNSYNIYRLVSLAVGIFLCTLGVGLLKNHNIFSVILLPIILILLTYGIDVLLIYKFNRIPIYALETKSSDNMSNYNSLFYRIYNCNDNLIIDYSYHLPYVCENDSLNTIDINSFLSNVQDTYHEYKNKFVKIKGKISKITGTETIELASFTTADNNINGYVSFNLDNVMQVKTDTDLSGYRIYDFIEVIGRVDDILNADGKKIITLSDTKLIPTTIYDDYSYEISENNKDELVKMNNNYYLYNLDFINVVYDQDNIYELNYLITDNRITWDNLILNQEYKTLKDKEDQVIANIYLLDQFNMWDCQNGKKIFASKKVNMKTNICELNEK